MDTIDSQHLRVFVALAHKLNMSRVAEELGLTPSSVSQSIKALEADIGSRLFERSPRRIALSKAGQDFLTRAEQILSLMHDARSQMRSWADWKSGKLRIGACATACRGILPPTLREFRESFPDYAVRIEQCRSKQALELIAREELDLGIFTEPAAYGGMNFVFLGEDDLQFIVNPLHPWAIQRAARHEEIAQRNVIVPDRGSDTYALIERHFKSEGITLKPVVEVADEDAIKQFVRLDLGVGIVPRWIAREELQLGQIVALPIGRRRLKRRWGVLHASNKRLGLAESLFVNIARNVIRELVSQSEV